VDKYDPIDYSSSPSQDYVHTVEYPFLRSVSGLWPVEDRSNALHSDALGAWENAYSRRRMRGDPYKLERRRRRRVRIALKATVSGCVS